MRTESVKNYNKNNFGSSSVFEKTGFTIPVNNNIPTPSLNVAKSDEYVSKKSNKALIFTGAALLGATTIAFCALAGKRRKFDCDYIKTLAQDMTDAFGVKINPKQLDCVMGKNELLSILPKYINENYFKGNIENGIFKLDLHSHTDFSDGKGKVADILNEAAEYGNKLFSKTKEKFIFSITDHDGVEGTKQALKLIAENPAKYKNMRFVPGVELSFIHACEPSSIQAGQNFGNPIEASELLVHCINPFSKNLNKYINNLQINRANMITKTLNSLSEKVKGVKFLREEMSGVYLKEPNENFAHSLHWRVNHYAQVKNRVAQIAQAQNQNPEKLYRALAGEWECDKNYKTLDAFNNFLSRKDLSSQMPQENSEIKAICAKYFPKIESGKITSEQESTFEQLIEMLSGEKDISAGFAHPAFMIKNFNKPEVALKDYTASSKGLIRTTEKYHQAYGESLQDGSLTQEHIDKTNNMLDELGLLPLGGHDNHAQQLF